MQKEMSSKLQYQVMAMSRKEVASNNCAVGLF
jgi:hypothetical protein